MLPQRHRIRIALHEEKTIGAALDAERLSRLLALSRGLISLGLDTEDRDAGAAGARQMVLACGLSGDSAAHDLVSHFVTELAARDRRGDHPLAVPAEQPRLSLHEDEAPFDPASPSGPKE